MTCLALGGAIGIAVGQMYSGEDYEEVEMVIAEKEIITQIKYIAPHPEQTWLTLKSPNSNICYEILLFHDWDNNSHGYGFMGMSTVSCGTIKSSIK